MHQTTLNDQPVIEAEGLDLRPLRQSDAGLIELYGSDERVARMTTSIPHPLPPGSTEAFILRSLAADATPALQQQLRDLAGQLAAALAGETAPTGAVLTVRELDVLAEIALGCTNAEAAQRLSLKAETVKSYLRSAATKLGAHTRHEAVSKARRGGLIA